VCLIQFLRVQSIRQEKKKKLSSTVAIVLVDGTNVRQNASVNSTTARKTATPIVHNQIHVKSTAAAMLLQNNSLKYVQDFFHVQI